MARVEGPGEGLEASQEVPLAALGQGDLVRQVVEGNLWSDGLSGEESGDWSGESVRDPGEALRRGILSHLNARLVALAQGLGVEALGRF